MPSHPSISANTLVDNIVNTLVDNIVNILVCNVVIVGTELQNVKFFTQINYFQMNLPQEKARKS